MKVDCLLSRSRGQWRCSHCDRNRSRSRGLSGRCCYGSYGLSWSYGSRRWCRSRRLSRWSGGNYELRGGGSHYWSKSYGCGYFCWRGCDRFRLSYGLWSGDRIDCGRGCCYRSFERLGLSVNRGFGTFRREDRLRRRLVRHGGRGSLLGIWRRSRSRNDQFRARCWCGLFRRSGGWVIRGFAHEEFS